MTGSEICAQLSSLLELIGARHSILSDRANHGDEIFRVNEPENGLRTFKVQFISQLNWKEYISWLFYGYKGKPCFGVKKHMHKCLHCHWGAGNF